MSHRKKENEIANCGVDGAPDVAFKHHIQASNVAILTDEWKLVEGVAFNWGADCIHQRSAAHAKHARNRHGTRTVETKSTK